MICNVKPEVQIWRFEIDKPNTGEMSITDPLLDTQDRSQQRAESIFLENAYITKQFTFRTYRTDLSLRQEVSIAGIWYKIINLTFNADKNKIITTVTIKRYE